MTWEEFFAEQSAQENNARAVMLQPFEHEDKVRGRKISLKPVGNAISGPRAIYELQVDDYICVFDQMTGDFKGARRA